MNFNFLTECVYLLHAFFRRRLGVLLQLSVFQVYVP